MVVLSATCFHHPHRVSRFAGPISRPDQPACSAALSQLAIAQSNNPRARAPISSGGAGTTPALCSSRRAFERARTTMMTGTSNSSKRPSATVSMRASRARAAGATRVLLITSTPSWWGAQAGVGPSWCGQGAPSARLGGVGASQDDGTGAGHHPAGMTQSRQCAVHPLRVMAGGPPVADITASSPTLRRVERRPVMSVLASTDYPLLNVMWTMVVFFMWVLWIWLLITVFSDLFRRRDVSGWGKAGWTVMLLVLPFLGVFIYLIAQGHAMQDRSMEDQKASKAQFDDYVGSVSSNGNGHSASEIGQAKQLLDSGAINADEYETLKAKALAS